MSRPINSYNINNKSSSSILQVVQQTQIAVPSATNSLNTNVTSLNLDNLTVKNIYLLDSLITKNLADGNAPDKLKISKGSLTNQFFSTDPTKLRLDFNNVYFQPEYGHPDRVTMYTNDKLTIGKTDNILELKGSNINVTVNDTFNVDGRVNLGEILVQELFVASKATVANIFINNITSLGNDTSSDANISINFIGTNTGIFKYSCE